MSQLIVETLDARETPSIEEKIAQISADFHNSKAGPEVGAIFEIPDTQVITNQSEAKLGNDIDDEVKKNNEDINSLFENLVSKNTEQKIDNNFEEAGLIEDKKEESIEESQQLPTSEPIAPVVGASSKNPAVEKEELENQKSIFNQELEAIINKDPQDIFKQEYESFSQRVESENKAIDESKIFNEDGSIIRTPQDENSDPQELSTSTLIDEIKLHSEKEIEVELRNNKDTIFSNEESLSSEIVQNETLDLEKELEELNAQKEIVNQPDPKIKKEIKLSQNSLEAQSAFSSFKNAANKIVKKTSAKDKKPEVIQDSLFGTASEGKSQSEFNFGTEEMKGIFKQDEPNLFKGEDLNTPAYARRK